MWHLGPWIAWSHTAGMLHTMLLRSNQNRGEARGALWGQPCLASSTSVLRLPSTHMQRAGKQKRRGREESTALLGLSSEAARELHSRLSVSRSIPVFTAPWVPPPKNKRILFLFFPFLPLRPFLWLSDKPLPCLDKLIFHAVGKKNEGPYCIRPFLSLSFFF